MAGHADGHGRWAGHHAAPRRAVTSKPGRRPGQRVLAVLGRQRDGPRGRQHRRGARRRDVRLRGRHGRGARRAVVAAGGRRPAWTPDLRRAAGCSGMTPPSRPRDDGARSEVATAGEMLEDLRPDELVDRDPEVAAVRNEVHGPCGISSERGPSSRPPLSWRPSRVVGDPVDDDGPLTLDMVGQQDVRGPSVSSIIATRIRRRRWRRPTARPARRRSRSCPPPRRGSACTGNRGIRTGPSLRSGYSSGRRDRPTHRPRAQPARPSINGMPISRVGRV